MLTRIATDINTLGAFCGRRDLSALTRERLLAQYGFDQADVMVLFGGSVLAGGDLLADAMACGVARTYVIVGGEGHTTETLRQRVHEDYPAIETAGQPEAVVFQRYLKAVHGRQADYLETSSTNCGNNITNLLALLREKGVPHHSVVLCQDATMQNRMDAGMRKYAPPDTVIVNCATYAARVVAAGEELAYAAPIYGMWTIGRYVNLLMGEIPRLRDDENGYGPVGKGYIAHVDIPPSVLAAYEQLKAVFGDETRAANPLYATK